jgi:hypothetical protein
VQRSSHLLLTQGIFLQISSAPLTLHIVHQAAPDPTSLSSFFPSQVMQILPIYQVFLADGWMDRAPRAFATGYFTRRIQPWHASSFLASFHLSARTCASSPRSQHTTIRLPLLQVLLSINRRARLVVLPVLGDLFNALRDERRQLKENHRKSAFDHPLVQQTWLYSFYSR